MIGLDDGRVSVRERRQLMFAGKEYFVPGNGAYPVRVEPGKRPSNRRAAFHRENIQLLAADLLQGSPEKLRQGHEIIFLSVQPGARLAVSRPVQRQHGATPQ